MSRRGENNLPLYVTTLTSVTNNLFGYMLTWHKTFHVHSVSVLEKDQIYSKIAAFCLFLHQLGIHWSVENPRRSYLWELGPFIELQQFARFYDFHACMHGSDRDKKTSFLATLDLSPLSVFCDGSHVHREWGLLDDNSFATAQEAEYPALLCKRLVHVVVEQVCESKSFSRNDFSELVGKQKSDVAVQSEPPKKTPPIISEFLRVAEVQVDGTAPTLNDKGCLRNDFKNIPAGSKQLCVKGNRVGSGDIATVFLFGIYRTMQQFVDTALELAHPVNMFCEFQIA